MLIVVCLTICGQQLNQQTNHYRSGDMLEKKQVAVKDFCLNANNGVWSLEDADISKKSYQTEYTTETDTIMMLEQGCRTYYNIGNGAVSIIGSENPQELISYDMPETWLKFPMHQGDSISGYFNGTGKYCDHLFIRHFGTYMTSADAVGKLVLPEGDTLRNVIRLHTERYVGMIVTPVDTMRSEIPVFTVDSIIAHMIPDTAKIREDVYRWYAEGYRYPVLEAKTISIGNEKLSEEIYYCPPEEQTALYDEENKQERERQKADEQRANSPDASRSPISRSDVTVNGQTVSVSFDLQEEATVKGLICTISGVVQHQQSQHFSAGTGCQLEFNCSNLRKGEYVLYLNVNDQVTSHVVSLK
jgi:hypothetical protein